MIKNIITKSVNTIRNLKYPVYDKVFECLIKGLRIRNINEVKRDNDVIFIFDKGFKNIKE